MMQRLLQFTLDLFDSAPAPAQPKTAPRKRRQNSKPKAPPAYTKPTLFAIENVANNDALPCTEAGPNAPAEPAQSLAQAVAPASFRHPHANRQALLAGVGVGYELRRRKRRTIGFSVTAEGLSVSAPTWVPLYEIDKSVQEKSSWIVGKLQALQDRQQRLESKRIVWQAGAALPFLGQPLVLVQDPSHAFAGVGAAIEPSADGLTPSTLKVALPQHASPEQLRDAVQAWLMRQAKRIFTERLNHFAPQLGVQWRKLSLSSAGTRWGSASADGAIRLHWRLVHFTLPIIDYVVVHELSHLRVMDHSPQFWDTVRSVMPDYAQRRSQLKEDGLPRW